MPDDRYEVVGFLPASGSDATGFLRVPQVEGAVGYEIYRGRQYELPDWLPKPAPGEPRRVPAAELVEAIRERIEDACTCDEALKDALLVAVEMHADDDTDLRPAELVGYTVMRWHRPPDDPCPTLVKIGEKLGIEIGDD